MNRKVLNCCSGKLAGGGVGSPLEDPEQNKLSVSSTDTCDRHIISLFTEFIMLQNSLASSLQGEFASASIWKSSSSKRNLAETESLCECHVIGGRLPASEL